MSVERLYSVPLTAFNTQSAGAELSVAAGGITVNAVNKIAVVNRSESRLTPVGTELWYTRYNATGIVQKLNQSDLTDAGFITLQWTGANSVYQIGAICVVGGFIYGLVRYKAVTNLKAVGKWDLLGNLITEFIDYVNPPADGELWNSGDMVSDGTYLYVTDRQVVGGQYYVKKFDLTGAFVDKCAVTPIQSNGICLGQDGFLYVTDWTGRRIAQINPGTMALTILVDTYVSQNFYMSGHINAIDGDHVYKGYGSDCIVSIQSIDGDNDYRGTFGRHAFDDVGKYTVATGRLAGAFVYPRLSGLSGYYLYWSDQNIIGVPFEIVFHKIYVREDRTAHTGTAPITGEADLKAKTGLAPVSGYKRLDIREDTDGGEITYYRSEDGAVWFEVTRASGFDLSAHPVASPLYLKAHLDNLHAKVGSPVVYGIDVVAQFTAIEGTGPDLSAYALTKDNLLEESRNILYAFIKYYANDATVLADGVEPWGDWISVSAKATDDAASPKDLEGNCRLTIDRIIPLAPRRGNYPEELTGEDHVVARRCNALITLQTHRSSRYRLEEVYAKLDDLIENRAGQLATKDLRRFVVSQPCAPAQATVNPDIAVVGILMEFEVTYPVEVVRS